MVETEPNDTAQQADGPVPAGGGYVATRATAGDDDRFFVRLQPQRQVALKRGSGCGVPELEPDQLFGLIPFEGVGTGV